MSVEQKPPVLAPRNRAVPVYVVRPPTGRPEQARRDDPDPAGLGYTLDEAIALLQRAYLS